MKTWLMGVLGFLILFADGKVYDCDKADIILIENGKVIFLQVDRQNKDLIPLLVIPQEDIGAIKPYQVRKEKI